MVGGWRETCALAGISPPPRIAPGPSAIWAFSGWRSLWTPPTSRDTPPSGRPVRCRIAAGEMVRSLSETRRLLDSVDVIQNDVVLAGGVTGCRMVAGWAEERTGCGRLTPGRRDSVCWPTSMSPWPSRRRSSSRCHTTPRPGPRNAGTSCSPFSSKSGRDGTYQGSARSRTRSRARPGGPGALPGRLSRGQTQGLWVVPEPNDWPRANRSKAKGRSSGTGSEPTSILATSLPIPVILKPWLESAIM